MAKAKSKTAVAASSVYKTSRRWETNRKARLERTIRKQPNNEQAKLALKGMVYRRKTPKAPEWSASWIAAAKLFKLFGGKFNRAIMSTSVDVSRAALQAQSPVAARTTLKPETKAMRESYFSIETRANMRTRS